MSGRVVIDVLSQKFSDNIKKLGGNQSLRRSRRKREDYIKMDLE
jgi:hypothetical protein